VNETYPAVRNPNMEPLHPGALLRETVLPALDMSVSEAARQLRISRQVLHRILSETSAVTPEMALRLGQFCGNGPELWLNLQATYDLWHARKAMAAEIRKIPTAKAKAA